jgi:hypothetical protein
MQRLLMKGMLGGGQADSPRSARSYASNEKMQSSFVMEKAKPSKDKVKATKAPKPVDNKGSKQQLANK